MHQGAVLVLTAFQCCDINNVRQTRLSALTIHEPFAAQQQPTAHHYYPHHTQAHFQVPSCSGTIVFSGTTVFCTNQSEQADLKFRDGQAIKVRHGKPPPFFGGTSELRPRAAPNGFGRLRQPQNISPNPNSFAHPAEMANQNSGLDKDPRLSPDPGAHHGLYWFSGSCQPSALKFDVILLPFFFRL